MLEPFRGDFTFGDTEPPADDEVRAAIDCLAGLYEVSLDDEELDNAHYDFTRDAASGTPGLVTYLPAENLEPGRHELKIVSPLRPDRDPDDPKRRHIIPFWK